MVLTREQLTEGWLEQLLSRQVDIRVLTAVERRASIERTLAGHRAGKDLWLFAYGSLIWNPLFHFAERRVARVSGFHRRFCLWTRLGRGSPERPGLVLGLDRGGCCAGVAFRIRATELVGELELVWRREMVTGAYHPTWVTARCAEERLRAVAFVINRKHPSYAAEVSHDAQVATLATAAGALGASAEYLFNTAEHLRELGIRDRGLERLCRAVRAWRDGAGR